MSINYSSTITGTSGLTNYWRFEGNGTATTGALSMTIASGYSTSSTGLDGNGLSADSSATKTGCYTTVANTFFNTTYSVELWFKVGQHRSSQQEIMRMSNDLALEIDTAGKVNYYYNGTNATSTATFDDNAWHHLVVTRDGSRIVKIYVDGTQVGTFTANTSAPASGNLYFAGSQYTTQAFITGQMDEVALYNVALSSGTVAAHYAAGSNGGYSAQAMTASATAPNAVGTGNVVSYPVNNDANISATSPTTPNDLGNVLLSTANGERALFGTATFSNLTGQHVSNALLKFDVQTVSGSPITFNLYRIDASWSESTVTWNTKPAMTLIGSQSKAVSTGWNDVDITSIVQSWLAGSQPNYGVALEVVGASDSMGIYTSESAGAEPYIYATYSLDAGVSPSASAMTASATMVAPSVSVETHISGGFSAGPMTATSAMADPVVSTTMGASVVGSPMTASGLLVAPAVSTVRQADISAEPLVANAIFGDSGFAQPGGYSVSPLTVSATFVDASVTTQRGPRVFAGSMTAAAEWKAPWVNGGPIVSTEGEDRYFQRVKSLNPKIWYRFNDHAYGAQNRTGVAPALYSGGLVSGMDGAAHGGVFVGRTDGPDGRGNFHFDGTGFIEQSEPGGTNVDENTDYDSTGVPKTTLDFSFKTTQSNAFLMAGKDNFRNPVTGTTSENSPKEIALKDGKITYRNYVWDFNAGRASSIGEFTGFKNLADGEWHSVSIRSNVYRNLEVGVEIWVDGKLEVRRVVTNQPAAFVGFPDYIGGRPDSIDGFAMLPLPGSQWFIGDISEVVFYDHHNSDHQTTRLYYDFMGWMPIEANPVEAFAFTPNGARGKGNQKRALFLYWYNIEDTYQIAGDLSSNTMNFDPLVGYGDQFSGYKVFTRSVTLAPNNQAYRDKVTDAQTIIDLEHDIDIDDFDVIMFKDWPDDGWEIEQEEYYYPGQRERLINQLRWANDKGIGLFVTQPRLAVDLGIVDRVEFVPSLRENKYVAQQGNALGLYDYGSASKFPWNIAASSGMEGTIYAGSMYNGVPMNTDPAFLANKAYFYGDSNKNDRFRVRALIEGLTDIPSYMTQDAIYQKDFNIWGWSGVAYKYLHRNSGLQIGDEYMFWGPDFGMDNDAVSADRSDQRVGRWYGYYATPLANVKAGTVVTTFGAKLWQGTAEVDNPYKDYATTIVLRRGDVLAGRPVVGRIYVNFTEQPSRQPESVAVQVLPVSDAGFPTNYRAPDTTAQRQWEWSFTRQSLSTTNPNQQYSNVAVTLPDGTVAVASVPAPTAGLTTSRSTNLFPIEYHLSWQMNRRGLWWLGQAEEFNTGDKIVAGTSMVATAAMPNPTVTAQRDNTVGVPPMVGLAQMPRVEEDDSGEVEIRTLPMTAEATWTGYGKTVSVGPMLAEAELVENFDFVHASGEQVVLFLHSADVTLFLKEEI